MTFQRDIDLIEDEIANGPRLERPRSISTHYLTEACNALHQAGDPDYLFRKFRPDRIPKPLGWHWMERWAREERFTQSVNCVIFSAFAAEAFINEFLAAHATSNSQLKRLDRLGVVDKYLKGATEVYEPLFRDGDEAMPVLRKLFRLRNELAHPKPGIGPPGLTGEPDPDLDARLALPELAEFVVMTAGVGDMLTFRAYGYESFDLWARTIWRGREIVRSFAKRCAPLPEPDAPAEPSIWALLDEHFAKQTPLPDHPDATWTRIRKAREAREAEDRS